MFRTFSQAKKAMYLLFGLIPLNDASGPEYADRLARTSVGDDYYGITELQIAEEANAIDVIVSVLTLGLFSMMTVQVEGQVHREGGSS